MAKSNSFTKPSLNTDIRPQDDFFKYVNSHWLEANPIPDSESRWGTFNVLRENAWLAMRTIYEDLQSSATAPGTVEQQAKDLYFTGIHFDDLKETHLKQLRELLAKIDAVNTTDDLSSLIGSLHFLDISGPWHSYIGVDHDDSTKHIFHFYQSGLTLPNRDYYLDDSDKMKSVRDEYKKHSKKVYAKLPELAPSASHLWKTVIDFETALAKVSRTPAELRDVENNFHKTPLKTLKANYPAINWSLYAKELSWRTSDQISVDQPEFMAFINDSFKNRPLGDWKVYFKWRLTTKLFSKISSDFAALHFEFFGKVLSGTTEIIPLWKRVVLATEHAIGEATGQLYAEKHFPESSKQEVLSIVEEVRTSYAERIDSLDWMSGKTRQYAKKKLANIKVLIGYPDVWRDFSGLNITRESYLGNILASQAYDVAYWLDKLHQPTSRDDWLMTPQTVNAYHDPTRLVICFPAGILQAPFFHPQASRAANLGGIGTVVGHELTHGFDDEGGMYDARGNVRTWQTKKEREAFTQKTQIIVKQADNFHVLPDLTLRGGLILGESIADLGGIELGLHTLKKKGHPSREMFKEFFINYAFTECAQLRDEKIREFTLSDPHPTSEFRVNGILQHVDDFYSTFEVQKTDPLYRPEEERAKIW